MNNFVNLIIIQKNIIKLFERIDIFNNLNNKKIIID